jgi:di/tricarboxylate transporter
MTFEIGLVLAILVATIILFVSGKLRVDLISLLVLGSLGVSGLISPAEALSGFSNPAVVTVWAMFIISAGLANTGIAKFIGQQVLKLGGTGEARLIIVIMITAGLLSGIMNNIGVAVLLLPVVMDVGRRTGHPPSRLLMPLAFGSLLGGLTTLIGTPANLLVANALSGHGLAAFQLFDFTPVGVIVLLGCTLFMVLLGRRLLPVRDPSAELTHPQKADWGIIYDLGERLFTVRVPDQSFLAGKSLASSRLGAALGFNVIGILRNGQTILSPSPQTILQPGDRLVVVGRPDRLDDLAGVGELQVETAPNESNGLLEAEIEMAKVGLSPSSPLIGQTLKQSDFRRRFGVNVLAIHRKGTAILKNLQDIQLRASDVLLVQGLPHKINTLQDNDDFLLSKIESAEISSLHESLLAIRIPEDSPLAGKTLADSHLGDAIGLTVISIYRAGSSLLAPPASEKLQPDDILLVEGDREDLQAISKLQKLEVETELTSDVKELETEQVGLAEAVLSPHSSLFDQTLRQIGFREKYRLSVVAIWREGRAYRSNLGNIPLRLGDGLLLYGHRDQMKRLAREPDFLVLYDEAQVMPDLAKAPLSVSILGLVLLPVLFGWLPISIMAVIGAGLMVLTRCLTMEEAYRAIDWRAVFLIAGTLPLGLALEQTGAAQMIADQVVAFVGVFGAFGLLAGLFLITSLATQAMPSVATVVLLAPIALSTSQDLGLSPYPFLMAVAMAASTGFHSPVSHPANILVLGPGGYRYSDYFKVGIPLTLVVFLLVMIFVPIFFPF